jgi:HAD superfamily hydrolase (TIGR01549 family)
MIKALIFDCYGVILADAFDIAYQKMGGDPVKDHAFISSTLHAFNRSQITADEFSEAVATRLGVSPDIWREVISSREDKDYRVLEWIKDLRKTYKTAMLSNIGSAGLRQRFTDDEIRSHFDACIASGDIGMTKPSPEIYEYAAAQLGVATEECIFIDDREDYCDGAARTGMKTVWYRSFVQAQAECTRLLYEANNP